VARRPPFSEIDDNVADPPPDELHLFDTTNAGEVPDAGWPDCPPPQQ
jgi:hypothetical protein